MSTDPRRRIPAVERLLASTAFEPLLHAAPRTLVVEALQTVQQRLRAALAEDGPAVAPDDDFAWYAARTADEIERMRASSLRPVINATGVVLHTNLGRAPLCASAREAIERIARGYGNLEYDLDEGGRGSRYDHCASLLTRLTGAEAALVVNNNAAALVLALNTLSRGRESVISRGELVEIGGSFRIPDIMARSGALMREVGSTNRTHLSDYADALSERTGALLKVHPSNFRVTGYTSDVDVREVVAMAHARGIPVINDLGSGLLIDPALLGLPYEPTAADAVGAGADVITMSGDKLLGGPQAGIMLGTEDVITRMKRNPLCRALRVDKLTLAALEATLAHYSDPDEAMREIPTLRMLTAPADEIGARAAPVARALRDVGYDVLEGDGASAVGGGAFPTAELPTRLLLARHERAGPSEIERRLRASRPPVIVRVMDERLVIDMRTVLAGEEDDLIRALTDAAG
jgi:L-seryl-tRNA(Ser) seleniumtransferase